MSFTVRELPKAKQDKRAIFCWLDDRSPAGAMNWLDAYDAVIERLKIDPTTFATALEQRDCGFDVRQALFKTRRGKIYRILFHIQGEEVFILRVRGPGQAKLSPEDI